jgi:hypothetical protein
MLFARQVSQAGAGLLIRHLRAVPVLLALSGCAQLTTEGQPIHNPLAAYDAARIAEGAYLASGHVDMPTLRRLAELDQAAREALDTWKTRPDPTSAQAATLSVAELTDYIRTETSF